MILSAQEFTKTFFNLPKQEQEEVFNLISAQRKKYVRKQLKTHFEQETQQTEGDRILAILKEAHLHSSEPIEEGQVSSIYKAFDEAGLIGCIETDEQLSTTYKEKIDFSFKHGTAK